ncbi:MAG: iron-containing alcohol dehydrogenase [Nitrososphaerota archaeon]|nr:iron-containing alcohol dehydrogenase [Nitrososphaerota archaeon]
MSSFESTFPTRIVYGYGSIDRVGLEARRIGLKGRCMLITGRRFAKSTGYLDRIKGIMESEGFDVYVYDRVKPNPTIDDVEDGVNQARMAAIDFFLAFGGGSAIDTAKMVSVASSLGGSIKDYLYPRIVDEPIKPVIAIPTTCGTGSEVTRYAIVTIGFRKLIVAGWSLVPRIAILDPETLRFLPPDQVAYTGLDALTHGLEAYFNRNASMLSDIYAIEAIRVVLGNLEDAYKGCMEARGILLYGSMNGGFAINMTGTTMIHGGGYYLTARYDLPHGLANALIMPPILKLNMESQPDRTLNLARILGLPSSSFEEASESILKAMVSIEDRIGIPSGLEALGIPVDDIARLAEEALTYKRNLENNPRDLSLREMMDIFDSVYRGRGV